MVCPMRPGQGVAYLAWNDNPLRVRSVSVLVSSGGHAVALFALGVGQGLAVACHGLVALTCVPLIAWMTATWPLRGSTRTAWAALPGSPKPFS